MPPTQSKDTREDGAIAAGSVPARRMGHILREARRERGMTLEQAALACGRFTPAELADYEAGRVWIPDEAVAILERIYASPGEALVPSRLRLAILPPSELHRAEDSDLASSPRDVMLRYLAVIYHLRGVAPGRRIDMRAVDVGILAEYLYAPVAEIETTLEVLMREAVSEIERYRFEVRTRPYDRRLNITVAVTAAGALILTRRRPG